MNARLKLYRQVKRHVNSLPNESLSDTTLVNKYLSNSTTYNALNVSPNARFFYTDSKGNCLQRVGVKIGDTRDHLGQGRFWQRHPATVMKDPLGRMKHSRYPVTQVGVCVKE